MSSDAGTPDASDVISAEIVEDWVEANNRRTAIEFLRSTTVMASILTVLFLSSTILYFMLDEEPVDYGASMVFDQERTRSFAEDLVSMGHPEWQGRMSGSAEEQATAEYIAN